MNRYDFYPGDFGRDTSDLTILEDGIYRRLLDWYYSNERPIPDERATLIVRALTDEEREKTQWVLNRFFTKEEEKPIGFSLGSSLVWRSSRCDREIAKARVQIEANRRNGKKGGRPKKTDGLPIQEPHQKPNGEPNGLANGNPLGNPIGNPNETLPSPSPSPSPYDLVDPSLRSGSPNTYVSTKDSNTPYKLLHVSTSEDTDKTKTKTKIKRKTKRSGNALVQSGGVEAKSTATWNAYSDAYTRRYGVYPVRNAKTSSLCCRLVDALGADNAPRVASYYPSSNYGYYVARGHALELCLSDCQKLLTELETGNRTTSTGAREADRLQHSGDGWQQIIEEKGT
jgi:uncharacterized protein YdaU (DUF1376 family)